VKDFEESVYRNVVNLRSDGYICDKCITRFSSAITRMGKSLKMHGTATPHYRSKENTGM
jgi:hypothetical protein